MESVEIETGLIKSYRYFEMTKELEITFRDGRRWVHANVPRGTMERMEKAQDVVYFWATQIRQVLDENEKKLYPVQQMREPAEGAD
jgi:hypothetical protein